MKTFEYHSLWLSFFAFNHLSEKGVKTKNGSRNSMEGEEIGRGGPDRPEHYRLKHNAAEDRLVICKGPI